MFAYCNNNPILYVDPRGTILDRPNTVAICDGGTSRFIYGQCNEPYEDMKMGIATVGHGGCGPIAVYNAMLLLNRKDIDFTEILSFYQNNNGLILGGLLGTSFNTAREYFEMQGYKTIALYAEEISLLSGIEASFDAGIVLFARSTNDFPYIGAHFVAFRQYDDAGYYFNWYNDLTHACRFSGCVQHCYGICRFGYLA